MLKCELCYNEHDGSYASGRFCSSRCSHSFSTRDKRQDINERISKSHKKNPLVLASIKYANEASRSIESRSKRSESYRNYWTEERRVEQSNRMKIVAESGVYSTKEHRIKMSKAVKGKTGGYRERGGRGKSGRYAGIWCQSSWELAFVIYMLDHGCDVERNKQGFQYALNGKIRNYFPDFIVDGKYYEISGWDNYIKLTKVAQCSVLIKLLYHDEMKPILQYVRSKHGKNFIRLYEGSVV